MDRIAFKAAIISTKNVLDNPDMFRDKNIMVLEIDKRYYSAMKTWAKQHGPFLSRVFVSFGFADSKWSDRAKKFYFMVRDRYCESTGDTTRANKDSVHHGNLMECEFRFPDGTVKEHLDELDRRELFEATQMMVRKLEGTEWDYTVRPQFNELMEDYRNGA